MHKKQFDLAVRLSKRAIFDLCDEQDTIILLSKILKRAGDIKSSYEIADFARRLDM